MKKCSKYLFVALCVFLLVGCNDTEEEKLDTNLSSKIILNEEDASAVCTVDKDYSDSEGYVMGVGAKMFTVAGPVLVFGISTSVIVGLVYLIFNTQSITLV